VVHLELFTSSCSPRAGTDNSHQHNPAEELRQPRNRTGERKNHRISPGALFLLIAPSAPASHFLVLRDFTTFFEPATLDHQQPPEAIKQLEPSNARNTMAPSAFESREYYL
jgi:hypothetical protein